MSAAAIYSEPELIRGRPVSRPPPVPVIRPPTLTAEGVLIQPLILPAPEGHPGSLVCSTFLPCKQLAASTTAKTTLPQQQSASLNSSSPLLHPLSSLRTVPLHHDAIICLHGGGQSRHTWHSAAIQMALQLNAMVITVDQRGHGESFWPRITATNIKSFYNPLAFGSDIDYLIKESHMYDPLNAGAAVSKNTPKRRIILVGASQGGISSMYSQSVSGLVSALILVDIAPRVEAVGVERIVGFMLPTSQQGFTDVEKACDAIEKYTPHRPRPLAENVRRNLRAHPSNGKLYWRWDPCYLLSRCGILERPVEGSIVAMDELQEALAHFIKHMDAESARSFDAASRIACPCLVVRADSSDVLSENGVEKLISVVPHAESIDVTNAHHMVVGDAADVFTASIVEWIQKVLKPKVAIAKL